MDVTDFAIYRFLAADGLCRFWASRRLVDPAVSARQIGDKIGLSEAGVRARLLSLKERGLLRGTQVCLNPSLFGSSTMVAEIPVDTPSDAPALFRELALVDGVTFARDVLDEQDRKVQVYFATESPAATARRGSLLRRLAPTSEIRGPTPYWVPPCERNPTPLEWRLLTVFRRRPDATLGEVADEARVSLKTAGRKLRGLVASRACWWTPSDASDEWPLALLSVSVGPGLDASAVRGEMERLYESWIPAAEDGTGEPPGAPGKPVAGLVPVETPAALERAVRGALALEGVSRVHRTFGLGSATFPQWFTERLTASLSRLR